MGDNEAQDGHDEFTIGELVAVRADPERSGPVIAALPIGDGGTRYRVFHTSTNVQEYSPGQLMSIGRPGVDHWAEGLSSGPLLEAVEFRSRLVAAQLAHPETDHVYALRSARIRFIPFQFKPLLRLLRSDRPRLLIADDVGVGKTIEAGLILKELGMRQTIDRALVLCPKALTSKWRAEMRRFDEHFRILSARDLRYCLSETMLEGEWPEEFSRSIVHYELARLEPYLVGGESRGRPAPGLLSLDPAPRFDFVIADEAHHVRTPGSGSHTLMQFLCDVSETVLMLSATPVQLHAHNLFVLLSLLRPDLFPDRATYDQVIEPNKHITRAVRALRAGPVGGGDWLDQVRSSLAAAAATPWGRTALAEDSAFARVQRNLASSELDDARRVASIRDLEDAHSLAHVMNRTRRRDIGKFTLREPVTVSVPFSAEQQEFYESVLAFRRKVLLQQHSPQVVNLVLDTLERQAASSITAMAEAIESVVAANGFDASEVTDDPEFGDSFESASEPTEFDAAELIAAAHRLSDEDPKYERLRDLIAETAEAEGPGKVLVFSFFLHTLSYLERRLALAGVRVELINGATPDDERELLRDRFRLDRAHPDAIDVLLSSEVGCEGLDYEFCDRLVNYDIPWNPMRLEQRIGRIDRFGQCSEKVFIFNFITPGTVEERVFYRCFERIGIFEDTVGDLEEVLGPMVKELTAIAASSSLTTDQAELRSRQVADNVLRLAEEQRRLDAESGVLLGLDDALVNDVDDVVDQHRFVGERELEDLIAMALVPFDGRLAEDGKDRRVLRMAPRSRSELSSRLRSLGGGRSTVGLVKALESGDAVRLTFNQDIALEDRSLDFVTPMHPLARFAVEFCESAPGPLIGDLLLRSPTIPVGNYLFVCERWETLAVRPELRLVCFALDIETGRIEDKVGERLWGWLGSTETQSSARPVLPFELALHRLGELSAASERARRSAIAALGVSNGVLVDRQLASLRGSFENRSDRVRIEIEESTEPRITTMKTAELTRVTTDFEHRVAELERTRSVEILTQRVAAGRLQVVSST